MRLYPIIVARDMEQMVISRSNAQKMAAMKQWHSTLNVGKRSGTTSRKPRMVGIGLIRF